MNPMFLAPTLGEKRPQVTFENRQANQASLPEWGIQVGYCGIMLEEHGGTSGRVLM